MIPQLLSHFKTYPSDNCRLSKTGMDNDNIITNQNFVYAYNSLLLITIGWVIYQIQIFPLISKRPSELIQPAHFFGKLFMPALPSEFIYDSIAIVTILVILIIFLYKKSIVLKALVSFSLLWLNLPDFSFGFQCHTAHLLLLSHIFSIFIPIDQIKDNQSNDEISKSIKWYYTGILSIYFYSGFWKICGIFFKILFKPNDLHWLKEDAAIYNAIVSLREIDNSLNNISNLFSFPLFWQVSFLFATYILTFSFFSAYRQPLKIWAGVSLMIFHTVNILVFSISFFTAQFVLACLFFPYDTLLKKTKNRLIKISSTNFTGGKIDAIYERIYLNGDKDVFKGYYAYRERILDRNRIIGGILYAPLLDITVTYIWKLTSIITMRSSGREAI